MLDRAGTSTDKNSTWESDSHFFLIDLFIWTLIYVTFLLIEQKTHYVYNQESTQQEETKNSNKLSIKLYMYASVLQAYEFWNFSVSM